MKKTLSIRLSDEQLQKVAEISETFEVKDIDVIRWGVTALIKYVDRHKGHLHLPIDFDTLWEEVKASAPAKAGAHIGVHRLNEDPPKQAKQPRAI